MYLERSWRRWRSQRWHQKAAKGRPSWTRKLSQPEMRFLEYVCSSQSISVIWFKSPILPWPATPWWCPLQLGGLPLHLLLLIQSKDDLLKQSAANLFPAEHSSFEESVPRTTRKDDFLMPAENCRAGNSSHTWKRWIQVKICCTSSVLCDLSKWQHLFQSNSKLSKYFEAFRSNSKQFWNQTAARAAGKCLVSSAFLLLLETWLLGSFLFALFHCLKPLSCSSCAAPPFELCSGGVDEVTVASNSLILSLGESGRL